jgi:hypothetical protein
MEAEQHVTVGFKRFYNLQLTDHVVTTFTNHTQHTQTIATIHTSDTTDQRATLLHITKPSCTNQRVIIVSKGEILSVECCLWSECTSLGTSELGFAA